MMSSSVCWNCAAATFKYLQFEVVGLAPRWNWMSNSSGWKWTRIIDLIWYNTGEIIVSKKNKSSLCVQRTLLPLLLIHPPLGQWSRVVEGKLCGPCALITGHDFFHPQSRKTVSPALRSHTLLEWDLSSAFLFVAIEQTRRTRRRVTICNKLIYLRILILLVLLPVSNLRGSRNSTGNLLKQDFVFTNSPALKGLCMIRWAYKVQFTKDPICLHWMNTGDEEA